MKTPYLAAGCLVFAGCAPRATACGNRDPVALRRRLSTVVRYYISYFAREQRFSSGCADTDALSGTFSLSPATGIHSRPRRSVRPAVLPRLCLCITSFLFIFYGYDPAPASSDIALAVLCIMPLNGDTYTETYSLYHIIPENATLFWDTSTKIFGQLRHMRRQAFFAEASRQRHGSENR